MLSLALDLLLRQMMVSRDLISTSQLLNQYIAFNDALCVHEQRSKSLDDACFAIARVLLEAEFRYTSLCICCGAREQEQRRSKLEHKHKLPGLLANLS